MYIDFLVHRQLVYHWDFDLAVFGRHDPPQALSGSAWINKVPTPAELGKPIKRSAIHLKLIDPKESVDDLLYRQWLGILMSPEKSRINVRQHIFT